MGKRRNKKKQRLKIIRSVITFCIVILLGLLSFLFKPWETFDQNTDVGNTSTLDQNQLQVHYIDVGQADAILVRVPTESGMKNMLIDAGSPLRQSSKDKITTDYLADLGIDTLHYMIITHPHFDHASAAAEVIEAVTIENLILPECEATQAFWIDMFEAMEAKNLEYIPSEVGDTYQIGDASFEVLAPLDVSKVKEINDYSIVIRLDYGETSFLFTGDAESVSESEMLNQYTAADLGADVLKVSHHGSSTSSTQRFLDLVDPDYAVISCGVDNSYGRPHSAVIDRLHARKLALFRTDTQGTIVLKTDGKELSFESLGKRNEDSASDYTVEYLYFNRKLSAIIAINSLFVGLPREL